jgi:hypothetical protein
MQRIADQYDIRYSAFLIPGHCRPGCEVPPSSDIPAMMDSLCAYLNACEMHPLVKAAIAHQIPDARAGVRIRASG